uniref:Immunoglobulin V-set domain-containing protein n=1 Tax=Poecilia formosa TaxID=48698 RepID=A0A087XLQ3_POEFO
MKMISLLLLILSSCLCATFVVNVTQSSYEAEENHSITLEWTFTTRTQGSYRELFIYCSLLAPGKELVLYQVHEGFEFPDFQDDQFSGRVQSDKDVLREGRIRLHVSRLRTEDSGLFVCDVKTEDGSGSGKCRLSVSGKNQRPTLTPEPERRIKFTGITAAAGIILFIIISFLIVFHKRRNKRNKTFKNLFSVQENIFKCIKSC